MVRYRHDIGEASTAGLLATTRTGDSHSNGVLGLDGLAYDLAKGELFFNVRPTGDLTCSLGGRLGDAIDYDNGRRAHIILLIRVLTYDIVRHLYVQLDDTFKQLDEASGRLCPANLTELRLVYQFNVRAFARAIVQRLDLKRNLDLHVEPQTSPSQELFTQLFFSYKLNPQTLVFVGYSNTNAGTESIPVETTNRTAFAKLGYAWLP